MQKFLEKIKLFPLVCPVSSTDTYDKNLRSCKLQFNTECGFLKDNCCYFMPVFYYRIFEVSVVRILIVKALDM